LTSIKTPTRSTVLRVDRFVGFNRQKYIYMREVVSMYTTIFLTRASKKLSNLLKLSRFNTVQRFGASVTCQTVVNPLSRPDNYGENNERKKGL